VIVFPPNEKIRRSNTCVPTTSPIGLDSDSRLNSVYLTLCRHQSKLTLVNGRLSLAYLRLPTGLESQLRHGGANFNLRQFPFQQPWANIFVTAQVLEFLPTRKGRARTLLFFQFPSKSNSTVSSLHGSNRVIYTSTWFYLALNASVWSALDSRVLLFQVGPKWLTIHDD
jgi:hypothetical protein